MYKNMLYTYGYMTLEYRKIERLLKGCANHNRLRMLELLKKEPELSVADISEKLNFYLDPSGHFWDKPISEFPVEYYNLLFGIKPKIVEYMDDSDKLIQVEFK